MIKITKGTWSKNGVEVIIFNGKRRFKEKQIETQLGHFPLYKHYMAVFFRS